MLESQKPTLKGSIFKAASLTQQGWKGLTGTNAVAYLASLSVRKKKLFLNISSLV
jgi:hypothetical protein